MRVLRQLAQGLGVLWGSVTLVFLIFSQVPDPARAIAGQNERTEAIEAFRELHGLNLPLGAAVRLRFLGELSPLGPTESGEWGLKWPGLGTSYFGGRPVVEALVEALPATMLLAFAAMGLASPWALPRLDAGVARRRALGAERHWRFHLGHECAVVFCGDPRGVGLGGGLA